jgi:outer membrane protein with beta-barrel domain
MTCISIAAAALLVAAPAAAQSSSSSDPGRLDLTIGVVWIGRADVGSRDANETTGTGEAFHLFSSSSTLASATGLEGHLGFRVMPRLEVEASASYAKPRLETQVNGDFETSNAPLTVSDTIQQFTIGGAALWYVRLPRVGTRVFLRGGVGYLRELENGGTLVVTGRTYDAGAGMKFALASRRTGWWKGIGVRVDARAVVRQKGVTLDGRAHTSPAAGAALFVRF